MDVHLPANRGHPKRDRGKDNDWEGGDLRSSDRASPAGGDVRALERRADQGTRKDDA